VHSVTEKAMLNDVEKDGEVLLLADGRRLVVSNDEDATVASIWMPPVCLTLRKGKHGTLSVTNDDSGETISVESTTGAVVADAGEWPLAGSAGASIRVITPFPVAARRTGHVDLPHPALGQGITLSPTEGRASLATDA
jgi:hypothetical protein